MPYLILSNIVLAVAIIISVLFFYRTRRFYLIRHGETLMNKEHIRQGTEGSLSEKGKQQADDVGLYLKQFSIGKIISSTYVRAKETSEMIAKRVNAPIIDSALLVERRNPSEIIGKHTNDTEVNSIVDRIDYSYHNDDYRFSDEENFADLKERARICLTMLASQRTRETVVVTHHVFLKMLVAYSLYRENLSAADFTKLTFFNFSDNASITILELHPWKIFSKTKGWRVVSYNQQPNFR